MNYRRIDRELDAATAAGKVQRVFSEPAKRSEEILFPSAALPLVGGEAAEYVVSNVADVAKSNFIYLWIKYTAGAAGGQFSLIPEINPGFAAGSSKSLSDFWVPLSVEGTPSSLVDLTKVPVGAIYAGNNFKSVEYTPREIVNSPSDGTETTTLYVPLSVQGAIYFRVQVVEKSAAAGTLEVRYTKSM